MPRLEQAGLRRAAADRIGRDAHGTIRDRPTGSARGGPAAPARRGRIYRRPGAAAHGVGHVLRSPHAHARIAAIDTGAAKQMPGVLGVFTEADLAVDGLGTMRCRMPRKRPDGSPMHQSPASGPRARRDAFRRRSRRLRGGRNARPGQGRGGGDFRHLRAAALGGPDRRRHQARRARRLAGLPRQYLQRLRAGRRQGGRRRLRRGASRHAPEIRHQPHRRQRDGAARLPRRIRCAPRPLHAVGRDRHDRIRCASAFAEDVFKIPENRLRVVAPDIGGAFGSKGTTAPENILALWVARKLGRPVKWIAERGEAFG